MYIGTQPYSGIRARHTYTATAGQTSFSGAGAENVTLTYADELYIDVYQNGVKLSPADYTATSGTTVVLAQGASVSDIVEVIKFDAFSVADTVSAKDGGGFGGNISTSGTLAVTSNATVGGTLGVTGAATVDGNINLPTANTFLLGAGHNVVQVDSTRTYLYGGTDGVQFRSADNSTVLGAIDNLGQMTLPLQPAFLAKVNSDQTNIATNSDVTVLFNVERFDQNADFDTGTYTFTAPVTGRYQLQTSLRLENVDTGGGYYQLKLVTSNATYATLISPLFSADASYWNMSHAVIADMDASDTAIVKIKQLQGTAQTDIDIESYFSGYLVC